MAVKGLKLEYKQTENQTRPQPAPHPLPVGNVMQNNFLFPPLQFCEAESESTPLSVCYLHAGRSSVHSSVHLSVLSSEAQTHKNLMFVCHSVTSSNQDMMHVNQNDCLFIRFDGVSYFSLVDQSVVLDPSGLVHCPPPPVKPSTYLISNLVLRPESCLDRAGPSRFWTGVSHRDERLPDV